MTALLTPREYYCQSREGLLYASTGWGAVRRWDGLADGWEDAGVPAPEVPPYFSPITNPLGFFSGSWTAYSRYIDRYGNPGNPSPPSTTLTIADVSGIIEDLGDSTPLRVTSTAHGLVQSTGRLDIPGTSVGNKIIIRWPVTGLEIEYYYDVIDEDTFDLYQDPTLELGVDPATTLTAGAEWSQNISGFVYDLANGDTENEVSGSVAEVFDDFPNRFRTNAAHGLTADVRPGKSDGRIEFGISLGTATAGPFYVKVVNSNHLEVFSDDTCDTAVELFTAGDTPGAGIIAGDTYSAYNWVVSDIPDSVVTIQVLRTKSGSGVAAYVDQESSDPTTTYFESSLADGELGEELVLLDPFTGDASYALRFGLPPKDKPYLSSVGGRMIAAGDPIWLAGTIAVTNGSTTVTGTSTAWAGDFEDRMLYVAGRSYTIASLTNFTHLELTEAYEGTTATGLSYAIAPSYRNQRFVQWSEAGYAEAFHPLSGVYLPADSDGGAVRGNYALDGAAFIACESRTFRFSFVLDPATDGQVVPAFDRGVVNDRCWVRTEDSVFALDRRGVYRTSGSSAEDVSWTIQDIFANQSPVWNIDWSYGDDFHGCFDSENDSILFFVSLTDSAPRHAMAYRLKTQAWEIMYYPLAMLASAVARIDHRQRVICGTSTGRVVVLNEGLRDGVEESGTLSGTVTSATTTTLTDSTASFGTVANAPVFIVAGTGKGQEARIASNTGTVLTLEAAWQGDTPDATSRYVIGGVQHHWKSGWFDWAVSDKEKKQSVALTYKPSAVASTYALKLYADQSDDAMTMGSDYRAYGITSQKGDADLLVDMTKSNGYARQQLDNTVESRADGWRRISVEVAGTTNGDRHTLHEITIDGASR